VISMEASRTIHLIEPILNEEMIKSVVNALRTERFLRGESVKRFEEEFGKYIGTKYALAVNSGTSALHLSLIAMGVKARDYVMTTPATFIATANAITYIGAKPIFVDISLETFNIDPQKLEETIKKYKDKVRVVEAIVPVHLYGYPCEMDAILEIAERYNVKILEDACQAHGAIYKGRRIGSLGDAGAFSFYPSKNMTVCGDGGMVTTNDDKIAEIVGSLRDVGRSKSNPYFHERIGYTARMNTINAAIGRVQLKYLEEWNEKRRKIAREYNKKLDGIGDLVLPPRESSEIKPVYHLYVVRTKYRDQLKEYLERKGIECGIHYPLPVHLQLPYKQIGFREGMFPNAERWAKEVLSLPMHPNLTKDDIEYVVSCIEVFFRGIKE
jgi:perosamine synthetase